MKTLYCPWRSKYAQTNGHGKTEETTKEECVFCSVIGSYNDEKEFVLRRFKYNLIMLNRFPYNAGHLLIIPNDHLAQLHYAEKDARIELIELTSISTKILQDTLKTQGINVGLNFGKAAGAGIPSHYHMHVLPRWTGDTNFLPILSQTKQISFDLSEIYHKLKSVFDTLPITQ